MKCIDADRLRTEINRRIKIHKELSKKPEMSDLKLELQMVDDNLQGIISFIDSLQQEQLEVDLEKEIEEHIIYMPHGEFASNNERQEDVEWARKEFRHFYKLGFNAKK